MTPMTSSPPAATGAAGRKEESPPPGGGGSDCCAATAAEFCCAGYRCTATAAELSCRGSCRCCQGQGGGSGCHNGGPADTAELLRPAHRAAAGSADIAARRSRRRGRGRLVQYRCRCRAVRDLHKTLAAELVARLDRVAACSADKTTCCGVQPDTGPVPGQRTAGEGVRRRLIGCRWCLICSRCRATAGLSGTFTRHLLQNLSPGLIGLPHALQTRPPAAAAAGSGAGTGAAY